MGFFDNVRSSLTETSQDLTQKAKEYDRDIQTGKFE